MTSHSPRPPPPPPSSINKSTTTTTTTTTSEKKLIWVKDPQQVWTIGQVISSNPQEKKVTVLVHGKEVILSNENGHEDDDVLLYEVNPTSSNDMTSLRHLHEPGILANLQARYHEKQIYTFMAAALLAVNPLQPIPNPPMTNYLQGNSNEPHPYAIAEVCYKNLLVLKKNQSVVINGESGAGKTETAKIVVKYLAERNRSAVVEGNLNQGKQISGDELYNKLSGISPILESFGNAKTGRNNNSSRFGKFMKLNFLLDGQHKVRSMQLTGATIETYLLEKSRVIHQGEGERNFHIFYSLIHEHQLLKEHKGKKNKTSFRIAKGLTGDLSKDLLEESHTIATVTTAFQTIGMSQSTIDELWKILTAILYLGDVTFIVQDTSEGPVAQIDPISEVDLTYAAELLNVDIEILRAVLIQREMTARSEKFLVPLSVREATFTRDAVVKAIYETLFGYIVQQINASLMPSRQYSSSTTTVEESFIGVLDIFGFESFQKNSFEQLLINYANEALQNTFNRQIFEKEITLFEQQKIEFVMGECPSNKECVDLISHKGESIFATLDSISRQPQPSDERFCEELHKAFARKNKHFGNVHRKDMRSVFIIQHYAGEVQYSVSLNNKTATTAGHHNNTANTTTSGGNSGKDETSSLMNDDDSWIVKNNDSTPDGLKFLFSTSSLSILQSFASSSSSLTEKTSGDGSKGPSKRRMSVMLKPTIVATFSRSMDELNSLLDSTQCHFIRCIKPNAAMQPKQFDNLYVIEQVRSLGILQACAVLSVSLPTRVSYLELKSALHGMVQKVNHLFPEENDVLLISSILRAFGIPSDLYRLGSTIAFFRPGQLSVLEKILNGYDNLTESQQNEIVQKITKSISNYQEVIQGIDIISKEVHDSAMNVMKLEKQQNLLKDLLNDLPAAVGLLDPQAFLQYQTQIEKHLDKLLMKSKECQATDQVIHDWIEEKKWKKGDHILIDQKIFPIIDSHVTLCQIVEKVFHHTTELFHSLSKKINRLEEESKKSEGQILNEKVKSNDSLYEQIMDNVTKAEELLSLIRINAERGDIDKTNAQYDLILEQLSLITSNSQQLASDLDLASKLLETVKDKASKMDSEMTDVESQARSIMEMINEAVVKANGSSEMKTKLNKTIAQVSIEIANATKPLPMAPGQHPTHAPTATTPGTAASSTTGTVSSPPPSFQERSEGEQERHKAQIAAAAAAVDKRRSSVSFSIKDLKALKEKKVDKETLLADRPSSDMSTNSNNDLPDGWKELVDPKSNRPYYVNKALKLRQWHRPTIAETAQAMRELGLDDNEKEKPKEEVTEADNNNTGGGSNNNEDSLPKGWRACVDKKTQRVYYVNDETKARQWRKPEAIQQSVDSVQVEDHRMSRRVTSRRTSFTAVTPPIGSPQQEIPGVVSEQITSSYSPSPSGALSSAIVDSNKRRIEEYRKRSASIISEELTYDQELDDEQKATVSYMIRLGHQSKLGYLSKQSKLLGRWRKRYFLLYDDILCYFESEKEFDVALHQNRGNLNDISRFVKADKIFRINGACITYFTNTEFCFSLSLYSNSTASLDVDAEPWYLLAENTEDMDEWMKAINGHIHLCFVKEHHLFGQDFWENGQLQLSLWKVPAVAYGGATVSRRPVGIRTLPRADGPRTGQGLFPGEIIEVIQILELGDQRYLRLADDRGWVFENHPVGKYAILIPAGGQVQEENVSYFYPQHFLEPLIVYSSPQCTKETRTGQRIKPGTHIETCAMWTIPAAILHNDPDDDMMFSFVKLADESGWVEVYHSVTGGQLLLPA